MEKIRKYKATIAIALILLLAAFLRLYRIEDYMTFLGDEGRDALVVYDILHGKFTLLGPTASVGGFFMGPIYYYFMAPFYWLFHYNPVGPAVMIALLGIATVWLMYKVGSEFFGKPAALCAAFLYTISPIVISYSRASWNPNPMPFFTLLTLYILYKAMKQQSWKLLFVVGVLFGICLQLHYIETFLAVIIAVYIAVVQFTIHRKTIRQKIITIGKDYLSVFAGTLVGLSPFLAFEIRHNSCISSSVLSSLQAIFQNNIYCLPNIGSIAKFILTSGETGSDSRFFSIITEVFTRLFTRIVTNYPTPNHFHVYDATNLSLWYGAGVVLAVLSVGVLFYQYRDSVRKHDTKFLQMTLIVMWLCIGVLLFGFYKKPIYDYYFEFLFPLPFLLIGNAFSFLWKKNVLLKLFVIIFFVWLLYINGRSAPFYYTPNKQLAQTREIAEFVLDKTEGKPFNFALITGGNSDHAYRYFFKITGRDPVTILNHQIDPQRKSVTDQLLVVCDSLPCSPPGHSLWEIAGFGRGEVIGKWNVSVVEVYKLRHYRGE